ncbi:MAG: signal peptidase I [Mogibacterium sp.]|nr:signal peptidase I [Mogibacterium sp.]
MRPLVNDAVQMAVQLRRKKAVCRERRNDLLLKAVAAGALGMIVWLKVLGAAVIHGSAMYPMLRDGDLVFYWRNTALQRGDAVLYEAEGTCIAGRVEAAAGSEIGLTGDGQVTIDGSFQPVQPQSGIFVKTYACSGSEGNYPFTVPEQSWYVLCDNRERVQDSRKYGLVRAEQVRGRIFLVLRIRQI